ncbi:lipase 5 [Endogone sp. FLAS-F59071]|nr:lipase 5 [Endogone sp. FLAS-F59071]|eukprot:RUS17453.1 lipase 5 [Endogone sp. FLAS-F59071]
MTTPSIPPVTGYMPSPPRTPQRRVSSSSVVEDEWDVDYINEEDMETFERALAEDPDRDNGSAEHISAYTDFMPIRQKVLKRDEKRKRKQQIDASADGFMYHLLRYPLMIMIGTIVFIELVMYIWLRQIVNVWEYTFSWRGAKRRLRAALRAARTYSDWCAAADRLDSFMNKDSWKETKEFGYYDYNLLTKVVRNLRNYRQALEDGEHVKSEDVENLEDLLRACVKSNFAGIENTRLYSHTYHGTKKLIEEFTEEATSSLNVLAATLDLPLDTKRSVLRTLARNYGRTALCLSGGAGFGYYHLGVIKALLENQLLPSVITGTSAGGLIAALVCCRTDAELVPLLIPRLATHLTACADPIPVWVVRFIRTGARFNSMDWARKVQWITRGSLTFREAYAHTGRILNISVVPFDPHSPPKLLNYLTAPDCVIWSAVIASAAVPGILNPVVLMQKTRTGKLVPYNFAGHRWKDGSLRTDIPLQALHNQFGVNYTIVSQVNPHVHLFFFANKGSPGRPSSHRAGKGWRGGFVLSSIEQYLKLDLTKWMKVLRDLELLPKLMDQDWSWIWLQKFDGNVTIWPKSTISDWFYILSDPTPTRLERFIRVGELQTWPKLSMISNRMTLERAIERARTEVRRRIKHGRRTAGDTGAGLGGSSGSGNGNGLYDRNLGSPGMGAMIGSSDIESPGENKLAEGSLEERRRRDFRRQFMDRLEGEEEVGVVRESGAAVQQGIPEQLVLEEEEEEGMLGHFDVEQIDLDAEDGLRNDDGGDEDENDWSEEEEEED